jgi:arsenite-transporting ATPase
MLPGFLRDEGIRLLLFGGKGGVGKTSCAVAAALYLAQQHPERSFLLVSTDPAHSLLDSLAGSVAPANLTVREIDPAECLARFKALHQGHLSTIAARGTFLDQSDIDQLLDLSMPGLDETMALLDIVAWVKADQYACIVVDTAPAGHTLRLLALPALMRQWVAALDAMLAKHRYMAKLYRGRYDKEAVDLYLEQTVSELDHLWTLLCSPTTCRFVPVMLAETMSLNVTAIMLEELKRLGLPVKEIVINRLLNASTTCPVCIDSFAQQTQAIKALRLQFSSHPLWTLPFFMAEVRGADRLSQVWPASQALVDAGASAARWLAELAPVTPPVPPPPWSQALVAQPVPLPDVAIKLLLFAGKGGVGKTTLACASAWHMAEAHPGREILLFSIDPAHSLGACLGRSIGPHEIRIAAGLSAIELNAQAEYAALKRDYAAELTGVFKRANAQSGATLAFDREVMERMLDVAPLGLDEMLALTRIVDLMDRGRYDLFVLDTAPTGHLLRFLEMPELIDQWLKTFFALFLKYRHVFWLPYIAQKMIELSKRIKIFRRLMSDPRQTALMGVAIPTEMALAETADLLAACKRLQIAVPSVFLNLLAPASACPVCSILQRAQALVRQQYEVLCAERHLAQVFKQPEPRGIAPLQALGTALYAA